MISVAPHLVYAHNISATLSNLLPGGEELWIRRLNKTIRVHVAFVQERIAVSARRRQFGKHPSHVVRIHVSATRSIVVDYERGGTKHIFTSL